MNCTENRVSPARPVDANGDPLSDRMRAGMPYVRKASTITGHAAAAAVLSSPSHARKKRLKWSLTVSG